MKGSYFNFWIFFFHLIFTIFGILVLALHILIINDGREHNEISTISVFKGIYAFLNIIILISNFSLINITILLYTIFYVFGLVYNLIKCNYDEEHNNSPKRLYTIVMKSISIIFLILAAFLVPRYKICPDPFCE